MDRKFKGKILGCAGVSAGLLGIALIMVAAFVPGSIDNKVKEGVADKLVLKNKGETYDDFISNHAKKDAPHEYKSFHLFDVTNPDDVEQGKKAILKEIGPYTYRKFVDRYDVEFTHGDERVESRKWEYYQFAPEQSCEGCDPTKDKITIANVGWGGALASAAQSAKDIEGLSMTQMDTLVITKLGIGAIMKVLEGFRTTIPGMLYAAYAPQILASDKDDKFKTALKEATEVSDEIADALFDTENKDTFLNPEATVKYWLPAINKDAEAVAHLAKTFELDEKALPAVLAWYGGYIQETVVPYIFNVFKDHIPVDEETKKPKGLDWLGDMQWSAGVVTKELFKKASIKDTPYGDKFPFAPELCGWAKTGKETDYALTIQQTLNIEETFASEEAQKLILSVVSLSLLKDFETIKILYSDLLGLDQDDKIIAFNDYFMTMGMKLVLEPKVLGKGAGLFIRDLKVNDAIWGYKDPLVSLADPNGSVNLNTNMTDKDAAMAYGKDVWGTGKSDIKDVKHVYQWHGQTVIKKVYPVEVEVTGHDNTQFAPNLDKGDLTTFMDEIQRTVVIEFQGKVKPVHDIEMYRFHLKMSQLDHPQPDYNMIEGYSGLINMTTLLPKPAPIVLSKPHFMQCDERLAQAVMLKVADDNVIDGMAPDESRHETNIDVDPVSGKTMHANKRLMASLKIRPGTQVYGDVKEAYIPLMWIDQRAELTKDQADTYKEKVYGARKLASGVMYGGYISGAVLFFFGIGLGVAALALMMMRRDRSNSSSMNADYAALP